MPDRTLLDHPIITERLFFPRREPLAEALEVACAEAALGCYRQPHPQPGAPTLVHYHGNGEVVADYLPDYARDIGALGVEVFMAEYRGYGASTGTPGLGAMLDDVDAVFAATGRPASEVIVYGRSIGSIYAIELAYRYPDIAGLVLESGIADVLERLLVRVTPRELGVSRAELEQIVAAHLDHRRKLSAYSGPLLVIHARDDDLIDLSHAQRNYEWAAGQSKELALFDRGGHNAIMSANWRDYVQVLQRFVAQIAK